MWIHGQITRNGEIENTSWRVHDGLATHVDLRGSYAMDDAITIDDGSYVIESMAFEDYGDRKTVPLVPKAEMDRRIAEADDAKAKAMADFKGEPWPPVKGAKTSTATVAETPVASG